MASTLQAMASTLLASLNLINMLRLYLAGAIQLHLHLFGQLGTSGGF